ncbi:MAG: hypothetical protein JWR44_2017 [Hymenobacter sp.]|jgi:hypothetical protein|nr:hypothetical protein [Hymenobacter sp.]
MLPDSDLSPTESRSDAALLALRPVLPAVVTTDAEATATVGTFLHGTLRPVLKLQNAPLLAVVADFVLDHHIPLAKASPADQQCLLTELLGRNTKLRYTVIGLITGFFTSEEYAFYRRHRPELNRRLLELAQRRVLDQTALLMAN